MCCVILSPQLSCISRSLSDLGNRSENSAGRGQILSILKVNSCSIDQESGEIWTVQTDLQQIYPKSDRLLEQDLRLEPYLLVVGSVRATGGGNRLLFVDIGIVGLKLQVVLVDVPRNRTGALYPMVAGDIPVRVDVGITGGQLELFRDHEIAGLGVEPLGACGVFGSMAIGLADEILALGGKAPPFEDRIDTGRIVIDRFAGADLPGGRKQRIAQRKPPLAFGVEAELVVGGRIVLL